MTHTKTYCLMLIVMLLTVCFFCTGCTKPETQDVPQPDSTFFTKSDEYIHTLNSITTAGKINGQVLVAKDGEILLSQGYGYADNETKSEITEDTVFLIASNTKPITAIAIMQLYERGKLDINDPISKYCPNQTRGDEITIAHLLNHTSGLKRDVLVSFYQGLSKQDLIKKINSAPLDYDPGTMSQYSNIDYNLLAYIIEQASGQTYEAYLKENIFDPLGMESTGAATSNNDLPKTAQGYRIGSSSLTKVTKPYDLSVFWGAGNIYSTVSDLLKLDNGLYNEDIITQETIELMQKNAYGWGPMSLSGHTYFGHNGLLNNGFSSTLLRFPHERLTVIVLTNVSNQDNITFNLAQALSMMALNEQVEALEEIQTESLTEQELERFTGDYELEGSVVTVQRQGDRLVLQPSPTEVNYIPYSKDSFYAKGSEYRRLKFITDEDGKISGFIFKECAVEFSFKKIS